MSFDFMHYKNKKLVFGKRTFIMGIINVTPDSFSDGGFFLNVDKAIKHGKFLESCGADILDVGGESTRPFARSISVDEEIGRIIPVIKGLSNSVSIPISVDTTKAEVAEEAILSGASIINDVSALLFDPDMIKVVVKYKVGVILMHMQGTPKDMQLNPVYDNLISEMKDFLYCAMDRAISAGVDFSALIIDPGLGFGKSLKHNFEIIKYINEFLILKVPILIGPSRKTFIRQTLRKKMDVDFSPVSSVVEMGTQAVIAAAVMSGVSIVRVHDVANTRITLNMIDFIKSNIQK